ncbi:DUF6090 family protein [Muriicola soli]|uniref:Uncharacterized protein n=1 Tax=Muriicola soli TaxID=2507538 RepID=A0A411EC66_9FLAO|nr:DUF6090 family protein [Muriicola soli]QBA65331.1 hypothetical protein EQY75_12800 [Muriicola soli]
MIKFFRKIRQQLISDNRIGKYLFYAIGEILLVVIGIVIALQIDNWNENRKSRLKEKVLLNQLKQEFTNDLNQIRNKTQQRNNIIYSSKKLLEYIDNDHLDNPDSIVYYLQRTVFIPTFNTSSKDFFTARDVGLIENDSLRALLADWPSQVDQLVEEEQQWVFYRDNYHIKFLTQHFRTRNIYDSVQEDMEMMETVFLDKSKSFNNRIGKSNRTTDPNLLLEEEDLEDHLGFSIMIHSIGNIQAETLSQHIKKILEQIDE